MKLIIHSMDRKEFFDLGDRDDLPRTIREQSAGDSVPRVELLGHSTSTSENSFTDEFSEVEPVEVNSENNEEFQEAEPTSWKHSKWTSILPVVAIAVLGVVWYFASRADRALPLSKIRVEGASLITDEEVLKLAAIDHSKPFYDIDLKQIERRLLTHSLIRGAHVRRELEPATLVLSIEERQPVAILRSDSARGVEKGETYLIDRDGMLLRPRLIAGLRDPARLVQAPLLSGVSARDTVGFRAMAKMVTYIASLDSGALKNAIGEFHRTPTGAFVLYTSETLTPIFLGSPFDQEFHRVIDDQNKQTSVGIEPLFYRQLDLLAHLWNARMRSEVQSGHALYLDARFNGEIILKQRFSNGANQPIVAGTVPTTQPNPVQYATNANQRTN